MNPRRRALTTSPQLTTYFLGYERMLGRCEAARAEAWERFELRSFMDRSIRAAHQPVNVNEPVNDPDPRRTWRQHRERPRGTGLVHVHGRESRRMEAELR